MRKACLMSEGASLKFVTGVLLVVFFVCQQPGCLASESDEGQMASSVLGSGRIFQEEIREVASPALDLEIENLVAEAMENSGTSGKLQYSEQHYNRVLQRVVASSKEVAE